MKIHHLRNATLVIESQDKFIIVDPMLSGKGALPPFSFFRFKRLKNPLVDLPEHAKEILPKVTDALITHSQTHGIRALQHTDHLDQPGEQFLIHRNIPVHTSSKDFDYLKKIGLKATISIPFWKKISFLNGSITAIPAKHGHSIMHNFMANGAGYFLDLPDSPTVYITGDTVLTEDVKKCLKELKPQVCILPCGSAQMDIGKPILMDIDEIIEFIKLAPNQVICNHMDALNHCPTTREILITRLKEENLLEKCLIPIDGEIINL